jgi:hypothetical protein
MQALAKQATKSYWIFNNFEIKFDFNEKTKNLEI